MCLGIPGQIEKIIDKAKFLGEVSVSGLRRTVNLACLQNDGAADRTWRNAG